jgi:hypothetical protein
MAAGPKLWTEERVQERFAEGRGQGAGDTYQPWVRVQEFASRGNQTRIPSVRLRRSIHTFSYLERAMYFWHEYLGFEDYREQVPLDRRITMGIAQVLKVRHPVYLHTAVPFVMMLDALVVKRDAAGKRFIEAWDAKPLEKLANPRIREKLKIHAAFCKHKGIKHQVFTESSVPKAVLRNIEWARSGLPLEDEWLVVPMLFTIEAVRFLTWLRSKRHRSLVWELCCHYDELRRFEYGTALRLFKFLVWHCRIVMDLNTPDIPNSHLPVQPGAEVIKHAAILHQ